MKNDDAHKLSVHQGQMKTLSAMVHERIPMLIRQKNYRRAKAAAEYAITEFQDLAKLRPAWKSATDDMIRKAKVLLTEILKTDKKGNANLNQSDFELWLKQSEILYTAWDEANKNLKKITGDTKGALTPDKIKESNEYKIAKQAQQKAFKALQDFNAKSPKEFKRRASKFNEKKGNVMTNNLQAKKLAVIKSNTAPEVKLKALEKLNAMLTNVSSAEERFKERLKVDLSKDPKLVGAKMVMVMSLKSIGAESMTKMIMDETKFENLKKYAKDIVAKYETSPRIITKEFAPEVKRLFKRAGVY